MKIKSYVAFLLLTFCFQSSMAQGVTTIETNKTEYAYGEPIELEFTLENPSDSLFIIYSSSSCQAHFRFNDFDSRANSICTLDFPPHFFSPGSYRTWSWVIEPMMLGLPDTTGTHTIVAGFGAYADTLQITAPKFIGGPLSVEISAGTPTDTLEAIKSKLNVVVYQTGLRDGDLTYEHWGIEGMTPDQAISTYANHPAFKSIKSNPVVYYDSIVNTQDEVTRTVDLESVVYPNPFKTTATLKITGGLDQHVLVKVYDLLGRERLTLYDDYLTETKQLEIDGSALTNGIYFYKVLGETVSHVGRFVIME